MALADLSERPGMLLFQGFLRLSVLGSQALCIGLMGLFCKRKFVGVLGGR